MTQPSRSGRAARALGGLLAAALLLAACSGGEADSGLPELLRELGFGERQASNAPPARNFSKSVEGLTLWVALPERSAKPKGPVLLVKVLGPGGAQDARTDQVLVERPEVGRLFATASQGTYPPEALKEVLGQALAGAARPPGQGAVVTSPKRGWSLSVPFEHGHLRLAALIRHGMP
ncbi:MAG: hypothetical protein K9K66_11390 [Desulfarculaceae bacterium]|nr:hypothetical protein [Desulfarculaceae bacterium]MCF8070814.1 hypothetical protein [Desulfarculaceae bacterium]MCF8102251.1 hypothetical protein [Desulfarculaceae bacterium]MCF8117687.1 hypothetical protein [Desulfarculaceae bacterium]